MRPPLRVAPYQPAGCQGSSAPLPLLQDLIAGKGKNE